MHKVLLFVLVLCVSFSFSNKAFAVSCTDYPSVTEDEWFEVDFNANFQLSTIDLVYLARFINLGWNYIAPNDIPDMVMMQIDATGNGVFNSYDEVFYAGLEYYFDLVQAPQSYAYDLADAITILRTVILGDCG